MARKAVRLRGRACRVRSCSASRLLPRRGRAGRRSISRTPCPLTAQALKTGSLPRRASSSISSSLRTLGRSRLLNWMTSGTSRDRATELLQVRAQVEERRGVVLRLGDLRVGDERDAVRALEHEAPRRGVDDLAGHGEDLDAQVHARRRRVSALKTSGSMSKKSVRSSFVSSVIRRPRLSSLHQLVERLQVGRLPAERRPVVDELDRDFTGGEVELHSDFLRACRAFHTTGDGMSVSWARARRKATRSPRLYSIRRSRSCSGHGASGDAGKTASLAGPSSSGQDARALLLPEGQHARLHPRGAGLHRLEDARSRRPAASSSACRATRVKSHCSFRDKFGVAIPLVSDPDRLLHEGFGAWGEKDDVRQEGARRDPQHVPREERQVVVKVWPSVKVDGHVDAVMAALGGKAPAAKPAAAAKTAKKKSAPKTTQLREDGRKGKGEGKEPVSGAGDVTVVWVAPEGASRRPACAPAPVMGVRTRRAPSSNGRAPAGSTCARRARARAEPSSRSTSRSRIGSKKSSIVHAKASRRSTPTSPSARSPAPRRCSASIPSSRRRHGCAPRSTAAGPHGGRASSRATITARRLAWQEAEALDGGRAAGIGEVAFPSRPRAAATLSVQGACHAQARRAARRHGARGHAGSGRRDDVPARRAGRRAPASSSSVDGETVFASWVTISEGAPSPPSPRPVIAVRVSNDGACTASSFGGVSTDGAGGIRAAGVTCDHWVAAMPAERTGTVLVARCERRRVRTAPRMADRRPRRHGRGRHAACAARRRVACLGNLDRPRRRRGRGDHDHADRDRRLRVAPDRAALRRRRRPGRVIFSCLARKNPARRVVPIHEGGSARDGKRVARIPDPCVPGSSFPSFLRTRAE